MSELPEWSTQCLDWDRRIVTGESLIPFEPLFPDQAEIAARYFGSLCMVDAQGSPMMSEVVRPWAMDFVRAVFGAYDPDTGRRHINEFLLCVAKKNGKSSIAAGVMLVALLMNWRASGEFIILAPTKEVADNSYKPIRDMIRADDELSALIQVQDHYRTVTHRESKATLKVVAADSDTVSGKKAIGVFVDELHEFGTQRKAANMLLEATGGLASRPEGFVIYATTQSADPPAGVFKKKLEYARGVRDGRIKDPSFLPLLYEFPPDMIKAGDHRKIENAYITNPNWGASIDAARIEKLHKQATEEGEESFRIFLAKHLNVEIGLALASDRWAGADFWESAGVALVDLDWLLAHCEVVTIGIDGGGLDDLLGLCVLGRERGTRRWVAWCHAWAHEIVLKRRQEIASVLKDFESDGDLTIVETPGQDVAEVAALVCRVRDAGLLPEKAGIGVDAAGIGDIVDALTAPGCDIDLEMIVGVSQGWRLNGAIKTTERRVAGGQLIHGGQRLMAWAVGNARTEAKGNAITITKQVSGSAKIDPLMALFDAVYLMALDPEPARKEYQLMFA